MACFQILLEVVTWKVQEAQGRSAFFSLFFWFGYVIDLGYLVLDGIKSFIYTIFILSFYLYCLLVRHHVCNLEKVTCPHFFDVSAFVLSVEITVQNECSIVE